MTRPTNHRLNRVESYQVRKSDPAVRMAPRIAAQRIPLPIIPRWGASRIPMATASAKAMMFMPQVSDVPAFSTTKETPNSRSPQFISSSALVSPVEFRAHHGDGRLVVCPPYPPQCKSGEKRGCTVSRDARLTVRRFVEAPSIISSLRVTPVKFTDYSDSRLSLQIMGFAT